MSNLMESDMSNREFHGAMNPDDVLHVTFYVRSVQNNFQTNKQGRPIFQDEDYIRIMIPGRSDLTLDKPVEERDKIRFPRQWAIFQNKQTDASQVSGTPVTEWPALTRAQADELKGQKFYTVEQIAACSDAQIQTLGMNANMLRQKARAYLASAENSALAQAQAAELERKNAEIAALKEAQQKQGDMLVQMQATIASMAAGAGKRGKPAKPERKPMSEEARKAAGARLKAAREAKRTATAAPAATVTAITPPEAPPSG